MTGEWEFSLKLAVFFELLWLDLFPAGTYIPPNVVACLLLTIAGSEYFGLRSSEEIAVPLLLSLPAAFISSKIEYIHRAMQDKSYNRALSWGRAGRGAAFAGDRETAPYGMIIWKATGELLAMQAVFFMLSLLVLIGTIIGLSSLMGHLPFIEGVSWNSLWFVSAVGGVLAVRIPRAYAIFIATCCLFLFYALSV
ncbi:hypothetical protein [Oleidesulfovibrio sp.]|uniref:hypothetical protein n=1 Tax=Oleidesulfovibrio sp. TaxID=2909707 RepID=UPI003A89E88C